MNQDFSANEIAFRPRASATSNCIRILGNFQNKFPLGNKPTDPTGHDLTADGIDRTRARRFIKNWLVSHKESILYEGPHAKRGRSEKWLEQNPAEFYGEIDRTVSELEISMEKLAETVNRFVFLSREKDPEPLYEELLEILLPVYIALRKKGYSRRDLIA